MAAKLLIFRETAKFLPSFLHLYRQKKCALAKIYRFCQGAPPKCIPVGCATL